MQTALRNHGLATDKSLGQHFLIDHAVVADIVTAASSYAGILEIGPGPGILTRPLALRHSVRALEVDERVIPIARAFAPQAEIIRADALTENLRAHLTDLPEPRAIVSNLPYYITHPLVERILTVRDLWSGAVLMMQKEVADKWLAPPGDRRRGSFSVFLQAVCEVESVRVVPPSAFLPPPKVDSRVVHLRPCSGASWPHETAEVVKRGFSQPRKTLANNLKGHPARDRIELLELDPLIRAQDLTESQWRALAARSE